MRREGFDDSCFRLVAEHCEKVFEANWKFLLFVLIGGLIGGYCTRIYGYDALSEDALAVLREQYHKGNGGDSLHAPIRHTVRPGACGHRYRDFRGNPFMEGVSVREKGYADHRIVTIVFRRMLKMNMTKKL